MKRKVKFGKKIEMWITAWLALTCAVVVILTFCYYQPDWDLKFWLRNAEQ